MLLSLLFLAVWFQRLSNLFQVLLNKYQQVSYFTWAQLGAILFPLAGAGLVHVQWLVGSWLMEDGLTWKH
jgi:hypothetical protein